MHVHYNTMRVDGRDALDVGKAFFNKEASRLYGELTGDEKEKLTEGPEVTMTSTEVNQRVRKITKRIQTMVCIW